MERAIAQLKKVLGIFDAGVPFRLMHLVDDIMLVAVLLTWFQPAIVAPSGTEQGPADPGEDGAGPSTADTTPTAPADAGTDSEGSELDMGELLAAMNDAERDDEASDNGEVDDLYPH